MCLSTTTRPCCIPAPRIETMRIGNCGGLIAIDPFKDGDRVSCISKQIVENSNFHGWLPCRSGRIISPSIMLSCGRIFVKDMLKGGLLRVGVEVI